MMSRIHGGGNKDTELVLAKLFRQHGIKGWRRNQQVLGKPDFIFQKLKLAIFADGCFWHNCPRHGTKPKSNRAYWHLKLSRNQSRDRLVNQALCRAGWRVLRIWEHELARKNEALLLNRIRRALAISKT